MRRRFTHLALLVALLLGASTPCALGAEDPLLRRIAARADAVFAAVEARDASALARLAAQDDPDPWLVADALFARGRLDAAKAFAKAAPRPDTERLPACLETLGGKADDVALRARLDRALGEAAEGRFAETVAITDPGLPSPLDCLLPMRFTYARAAALANVGRLAEASPLALSLARDAERLGWLRLASRACEIAGGTALQAGGNAAARDAFALGLAVNERRGPAATRTTAEFQGRFADALAAQGASGEAIAYYRRALATFETLGDTLWQAYVHRGLGRSLVHQGEARGYDDLAQALRLFETSGDRREAALTSFEIGGLRMEQGQDEAARAAFERAAAAFEALGDTGTASGALINLGILRRKAGQTDEAVALLDRGRGFAQAAQNGEWEVNALAPLLETYLARGDLERAAATADRLATVTEQLGRTHEVGYALWQLGNARARRGEPAAAVAAFSRAVERLPTGDYRAGLLRTRSLLGYPADATFDRGEALAALDRVLSEARTQGNLRVVGELEWALGDERSGARDFAAARDRFTKAREALLAAGQPARAAEVLLDVASTIAAENDLPKALAAQEQALRESEAAGDRVGVGVALWRMAALHLDHGDLLRALPAAERALSVAVDRDDRFAAASALNAIGIVWTYREEYAKALAAYERALAIYRAFSVGDGAANCLLNIGNVHASIGDLERALQYQRSALAAFENRADPTGEALALAAVGSTLVKLERLDEAGVALDRALSLQQRLGNERWVARVRLDLAELARARKDWPRALEILEGSLRTYETLGERLWAAWALDMIGEVHEATGNDRKALQVLERAGRAAETVGSVGLQVRVLQGIARLRLKAGDAGRAVDAAHRAVTMLKSVVGGLGEEQGATIRGQFAGLFATGLAAAVKADDAAEAVFFLESGRAGSLLEAMGTQAALLSAAVPDELRAAERDARAAEAQARAAYAKAAEGDDVAARRARQAELDAAQARVAEAVERIEREEKKAQLWYPVAAPIEDLQALLAPEEALVLYGLPAEGAAHAVVLTREEARIVDLGAASDLAQACESTQADDPAEDPSAALERLRGMAVAPLALGAQVRRVLVSPEGPLSYVPFAALISDVEVVHAASGSTYAQTIGERTITGQKVLALADPDYAARFEPAALAVYALDQRGAVATTRGRVLAALPGTRAEAEALADVRLLGKEASEAGLRQALDAHGERWRSVHFACHGLVDPERPTLSSLVLTPDGSNDGFLTALEVLRMRIPADLVVLSACETGRGKIVTGEGIVGLTRAFMHAGAPRVICSLWKVDDEATRALMTKFYEVWKGDQASTAGALREAQAFIRAQEKWKHPYYWAAWVLWGLP